MNFIKELSKMEEVKIEVTLKLATKFQNQLARRILKGKLFELQNILHVSNKKNKLQDVYYNGEDLLLERRGEIMNKIMNKFGSK
jgi:hypothetical protein